MSETPTGQTLSTLEVSVRRLIQEEDTTNSNFETEEIYDYLNEGLRRLSTKLEWQLAIFTTNSVQDQQVYTIPDHLICIVDIYFDGTKLAFLDRAAMTNVNYGWMDEAAGTPRFAYKEDRNKIGLYPKPDSANASLELRMQGIKMPDTLVDSTDAPDVHIALQDALPYFAAFRCEWKAGNRDRAADALKLFKDSISEVQTQLIKFAEQLNAFTFDGRYVDEPRTL